MDNVQFNVRGDKQEDLLLALQLAFSVTGHQKAVGYKIIKNKGLILYWTEAEDIEKFIVPMKPEELLPTIQVFLDDFYDCNTYGIELSEDEWDDMPDDDEIGGHYGWRIYTETWGRINDDWKSFLAITPSYCWLSK